MKLLKKMNKIIIALFFLGFVFQVNAQHNPQFTHFMFNKLLYNPAYAGNRDALAASAVYRNQWLGIDGAPVTLNFNVHTPFAGDRAGVGLSVVSDKIGVVNTTFATLSYNYRVPVGETAKLSLGISGRLEHGRMDFTQLDGYDQGDDFIMSDITNVVKPNFGFGLFLSNNNYYVGVSMPTVLENTLYTDSGFESVYRTFYLMGAVIFDISEHVKLKPSALVSVNKNAPLDLDLNASFLFMDALWVGATYRMGDSVDALIQYQFTPNLRAGMAFDFTTSELNANTAGGYELMLEYIFDRKDRQLTNIRYF